VKLKLFPEPIKVGPQREHRWRSADIELWIDRQQRHPAPKRLRGALARQVQP
jgi:predicted DNA-binding transcriptional regulator AlpA